VRESVRRVNVSEMGALCFLRVLGYETAEFDVAGAKGQ
jgi:hypothetical protein